MRVMIDRQFLILVVSRSSAILDLYFGALGSGKQLRWVRDDQSRQRRVHVEGSVETQEPVSYGDVLAIAAKILGDREVGDSVHPDKLVVRVSVAPSNDALSFRCLRVLRSFDTAIAPSSLAEITGGCGMWELCASDLAS